MKKTVLLLVLSVIATCALATGLTPRRTVVAGRVLNLDSADQRVMTVIFCDPISDEDRVANRLTPEGGFHAQYDMCLSQNITINYGGRFINVYVNPADSIYLEIDMAKFRRNDWAGLKFSGSGAELNNQFAPFCNYLYSLERREVDRTLPPREFVEDVKKSVALMQDSVRAYAQRNELLPFITQWARRDIIYSLANGILDYGEDDPAAQLAVFTDPIFDIYNADNFQTMMYPYHLGVVRYAMFRTDKRFAECAEARDIAGAMLVGVDVLSALPASLARDIMLYDFVSSVVKETPELFDSIPKNIFTDKKFERMLGALVDRTLQAEFDTTPIKGVSYVDAQGTVHSVAEGDFIQYLARRYPAKVLYIDVWATWCGPCRAAFPFASELHKLYGDTSDVVFVNLCLGSELKYWQPTIAKYGVGGENYFFDKDASALFMSVYGLSGYPSYIVVGRDGRIVTKNAPGPENTSGVSKLLDELSAQ